MKKFIWLLLLFLVSCGQVPATRYFTLDYDYTTPGLSAGKGILFIKKLKSDPVYYQDKMIYKTSRYEVKFDNYRRWIMEPSDLMTYKAAEHLRRTGIFERVTMISPGEQDFLMLDGILKNFEEVVEQNKRIAKVTIYFELQKSREEKIFWSKEISASVPITGTGVEGIIESMSIATRQVFDELVKNLNNLN